MYNHLHITPDLTGVICDPKITVVALKGKIYKAMIRPVIMYGAEAWTLRRKEEKLLERTEMRMLRYECMSMYVCMYVHCTGHWNLSKRYAKK